MRLLAADLAGRLAWRGSVFDFSLEANHRAVVSGLVAGVLAVGALSLTGSSGLEQQIASDPLRRAAAQAGGSFGPEGLQRISRGLGPFAAGLAENIDREPWAPAGSTGWANYDLAHPPALVGRNLTFDEARAFNALVAPSATAIASMKPFNPRSGAGDRERALTCLTQAVYYEAGFETGEGQQAVAQVVLNRVRHPGYPSSVCGVVYQGASRQTGCQFSFTCDGSLARPPAEAAWARARDVAKQALGGYVYKPIGTSTHYHADYVFPYWAVTLVKLRQIGTHIFYRMTGPNGRPDAFSSRYAGAETVTAAVLTGGDSLTPDAPSSVAPAGGRTAGQSVTLTVGGETRTYIVAPIPGTPAADEAPGAAPPPIGGPRPLTLTAAPQLTPTRRLPTPDEIAQINASLKKFEDGQVRLKAEAPASVIPRLAPAPPGIVQRPPAKVATASAPSAPAAAPKATAE